MVPTIRKLVVAVGSGVITFDSLPDFETKSIYEITVEVSDGTNSVSQELTIDVTNIGDIWVQRGDDIDGEAVFDQSGYSVSLSADSDTVAIGAPFNDDSGTNAGHVRIYDWFDAVWTQRGEDINGEATRPWSGYSVSLSEDGDTVAIGAPANTGSNAGHVRIYDWDGSSWTQRGDDIDGEAAGDSSGSSVSLSEDGNTVAIGATGNDDGGTKAGHVRIFDWDGSVWTQRGDDIDGEGPDDWSGSPLSLSEDGNTIAIGARFNDGWTSQTGHVRIFDWDGSAWTQRGADIDGEAAGDTSGNAISLSEDGNTVAIGASGNQDGGDDAGHVRIYDWSDDAWAQRGDDIDGEAVFDRSGSSVSLSEDGNTVAIGASHNRDGGRDAGHVRIYDWQ